MSDRLRQLAVISFAILDIASSFWLGDSLDQGSSATPVYFLPFGPTFAIWGVIFSGQLIYAVYQAMPAQQQRPLHRRIGGWVALNAALTALWNFTAGQAGTEGSSSFQPIYVVLTVFILAGMLFSLTRVFVLFQQMTADLTAQDRWLAQIPLTIFFAWLNVAAIANTTAALDAVGVPSEPNGALWAAAMLVVAAVLAALMILYSRPNAATIAYSGVIVWAAVGIFFNNLDRSALVAGTCVAAAAVVIVVTSLHLYQNRPSRPLRAPVVSK